jgi:preprotein translocase subunit SecD
MRSSHRGGPAAALLAALVALGPALAGCSSDPADSSAGPSADRASTSASATASSGGGDTTVTYDATAAPGGDLMQRTADRLRARAKAFGLAGALIAVHGSTITAQTPGDAADKLRRMAATAELLFRPALAPSRSTPPDLRKRYDALRCAAPSSATPSSTATPAAAKPGAADQPTVGCDRTTGMKYLMGPAELDGSEVKSAKAQLDSQSHEWTVMLDFTPAGRTAFAKSTARLARLVPPGNQLAMVLDGTIISAPSVQSAITGGQAQIAGDFKQADAESLAALLTGGALPIPLVVKDVTKD